MNEIISVEHVIAVLNGALALDRAAVTDLIGFHVPCNEALADHPSIQCGDDGVGVLGILNGLFGAYNEYELEHGSSLVGFGPIAAVFNSGKLEKFTRTSDYEIVGK